MLSFSYSPDIIIKILANENEKLKEKRPRAKKLNDGLISFFSLSMLEAQHKVKQLEIFKIDFRFSDRLGTNN